MGRKAKKNYSCDFETTTDENDCRVWAYGYMEIGNDRNFKIGNNLDDFMKWAEKELGNLYFHNLKFDGSFILNWLFRNGFTYDRTGKKPRSFSTTISGMGQWYAIDIMYGWSGKNKKTVKIFDSLKKLPMTVKKIAQSFKLKVLKGDIDYKAYRPVGHEITHDEYEYIYNDIAIIADALHIQFEQGLTSMTVGSDSMKSYKDEDPERFKMLFPAMTVEEDAIIRPAYKGGFTWLNPRYRGVEVYGGEVFDVNSLYPAMMRHKMLPFGMHIHYEGKYIEDSSRPIYIQRIACEFDLKEGHIPTIQIKGNARWLETEYLTSSKGNVEELYLTNIDLDLFLEQYHVHEIHYIECWAYQAKTGMFDNFIDFWSKIKKKEEGGLRELAKLQLNNLYGKFATNPDVTGKHPEWLENHGKFRLFKYVAEDNQEIKEYKDPVYAPMGIFITSYARELTIRTAQACYDRIIYCDTDSIHLEGFGTPESIKDIVHPKDLGMWAHESTFRRGKFIRQKTYLEESIKVLTEEGGFGYWKLRNYRVNGNKVKIKMPRPDIKCAGMPENVKQYASWSNFKKGFTADGKLTPKQVAGGVVLQETYFTMK